jgi:putative nucleotide binding protein
MKNENFGLVIGTRDGEDKKTARIIGYDYFILMDLDLNEDVDVKLQDKIPLGKDSEFVKQERAHLSYDDLNKNEEFEVEKAVFSIVIANEPKYVKFFNDQSKEASQLHFLDPLNRKKGSKIIAEKELNGDFESFEDIDNRVSFIESSKDLIVNRVLYELIELPKVKKGRSLYLFTKVKRSNKKEVQEYDEFVTDDSRFIEMIKEKGLLEKEGKRIR